MTAFRKCKNKRCRMAPAPGQAYCSRECAPYGRLGLFSNGKSWATRGAEPAQKEREMQRRLERPSSIYDRDLWGGR